MSKYKKIKHALLLNDQKINTLTELRESCTIDKLLEIYQDGRLKRWLVGFKQKELISKIDGIYSNECLEPNDLQEKLYIIEKLVEILDIDRNFLDDYKLQKYKFYLKAGKEALNNKEYYEAIMHFDNAVVFESNKYELLQ